MATLALPPRRTPAQSPSPPVYRSPMEEIPEAPEASSFERFLVTPITFVSFLISLFLIDSHNSSLRYHQHSSPYTPPNTLFGRTRAFVHNLFYKPQPYTYITSPYRGPQPENEKTREAEPWHWHTKQRHMMKMEVSEAFRVRQWVLAGMVFLMGGLGWLTVFLGHKAWQTWS